MMLNMPANFDPHRSLFNRLRHWLLVWRRNWRIVRILVRPFLTGRVPFVIIMSARRGKDGRFLVYVRLVWAWTAGSARRYAEQVVHQMFSDLKFVDHSVLVYTWRELTKLGS
ncbi:MAG: hypothetical protein IPO08_22620 [Xanthomonadales bacterium]|nr:hypothetical protein [Xanthomonadales bacterium]